MSKKLVLNCDMNNGTKKTYAITEPKSGVTLAQCSATFDVIKEKKLFKIKNVEPTELIGAYYEEVIHTDIIE